MSYCKFCGTAVESGVRFCAACGKPANTSVPSANPTAANVGSLSRDNLPASSHMGSSRPPTGNPCGTQIKDGIIVRKRPGGVTGISILALIMTLIMGMAGLWLLAFRSEMSMASSIPLTQLLCQLIPAFGRGQQEMMGELGFGALEVLTISAICAIVSYGLWRIYNWGRIMAIVVSAFVVLHAAVMIYTSAGTLIWHLFAVALNIWIIVYLLKARVKNAFAG